MTDPKAEPYTYALSTVSWRKSSAGGPEHDCVEIANLPDGAKAIRDSKRPTTAQLRRTAAEWDAFRDGVVSGGL